MRLPSDHTNSRIRRQRDFGALSRLLLLLALGAALASGFLFAAYQHVVAIQLGYKNEELRREQQRLLADQKRLKLAKEEAFAPALLEPAARGVGLQPIAPGQVVVNSDDQRKEPHPAAMVNPAAALHR